MEVKYFLRSEQFEKPEFLRYSNPRKAIEELAEAYPEAHTWTALEDTPLAPLSLIYMDDQGLLPVQLLSPEELFGLVKQWSAVNAERQKRSTDDSPSETTRRFEYLLHDEPSTMPSVWGTVSDAALDAFYALKRFARDYSDLPYAYSRLHEIYLRLRQGWNHGDAHEMAEYYTRTIPAMLTYLRNLGHYSSGMKQEEDITPAEWRESLLDGSWGYGASWSLEEIWDDFAPRIIRAFNNFAILHYGVEGHASDKGFPFFNLTEEERKYITDEFLAANALLGKHIFEFYV